MGIRTGSIIRRTAVALAAALVLGACSGAPHQRTITLTLVRHAESDSNAAGIIDTSTPGPNLTEKGRIQAQDIAHELQHNHYDGVYASSMARAQQTAAPLAAEIGRQVQVLPGLREIGAGWFEDKSSKNADATYLVAPEDWIRGQRTATIPGSIDGNQFNEEFTAAVQRIYEAGDANPVAFSHSAAIMTWVLMNVKNPRDELMVDHPLPNTGKVVVTGSPTTGWKLVDWDGIRAFN